MELQVALILAPEDHTFRVLVQRQDMTGAELERDLIMERVRAGMRRARLEGQHMGHNPLVLDNAAIQRDRDKGQRPRQIAKGHRISTATVRRVLSMSPPEFLDKTV